MLNFNKLRLTVFEIFNNSQLFLTDPRIFFLFHTHVNTWEMKITALFFAIIVSLFTFILFHVNSRKPIY